MSLETSRLCRYIDRVLFFASAYGVPAIIVVASLAALLGARCEFASQSGTHLALHVVDDASGNLTPPEALTALRRVSGITRYSTRLAETPFWFALGPAFDKTENSSVVVEFPSRHAQTLSCWNALTMSLLGTASRSTTTGDLFPIKAGFAIPLAPSDIILCRGTFSGPAYIEAYAWSAEVLNHSARQFQENAALIAGGLITLSIFVFLTALVNREWTYVIFAVWLLGNMRICANAMGWDTQWLGRIIPPDMLPLLRAFTFAAYYLVTVELFKRLFRDQLKIVGHGPLLRLAQCGSLPLLAAAGGLPYRSFIPILWALSGFGISVLVFILARIIWHAGSRTVMWFVVSMATLLYSIISEVCNAAFGFTLLPGGSDPVVTVLMSSLMATIAIAEHIRAERDGNRRAQARLRNTYDVTPVGLFTLDSSGRFLQTNAVLREMLNMHERSYGLSSWQDYFDTEPLPGRAHGAKTCHAEEVEIRPHASLEICDRRYLLKAICSNNCVEGSLQDVTERSEAVERLRFLADHDSLSGLMNRHGVEQTIQSMTPQSAPWALAYIDLDRFKLINDLFGHHAGDHVLQQVAVRMRGYFGPEVGLARIGGDEFVCVMPNTSIENASAQCRELAVILSDAPYQFGHRAFQVRASIGIVECMGMSRAQDALAHADRACREAKKNAHSRTVTYRRGAPIFDSHNRQLKLVEILRQNRLPSGLFLMMQPIVSLAAPTHSLNFEVLLRIRAADGTVGLAGEIIVAAEESGNIAAIDRWVLTNVLDWIDSNRKSLDGTRFICVNLSGGSLNDEQFVEDVCALLKKHPASASLLCLEITETIALHDLANTQKFIARVHELGAKIAFDDFGAGYTSFRYLKDMSADALKIDGEFIRSISDSPANVAIVEAIVSLARNLGMRSIAESVEDVRTLHILREINVDYVQGYAVAKPQHASDILDAHGAIDLIAGDEVMEELRRLSGSDPRDDLELSE